MKRLLTRQFVSLLVLMTFGLILNACYPIALQPRGEDEPLLVSEAPQTPGESDKPQSPDDPSGARGENPGNNTPLPTETLTTSEAQPTPTVQESIIFENPEAAPIETPTVVEETPAGDAAPKPIFDSFVESLKNGNPNQIVGVYVDGVLALRVVQQPPGNAAYVSIRDGEATQFLLAWTIASNVGLLAHNYLAGVYYFNLRSGDIIELIYGDGSVTEYEVDDLREYQALNPESSVSDFVNLGSGATLTATNLFYEVYGGDHHVTFQTCIARDNSGEWGRLFVLAPPL